MTASTCRRFLARASFLLVTCLVACSSQDASGDTLPAARQAFDTAGPLLVVAWTGRKAAAWKDFDRLREEQKYEEAAKVVEKILERARTAKDGEEWTRALIRTVQIRMALHGYETAVRFLKDEPWPTDLLSRVSLNLFYAHSLTTYAHAYSWEIHQREKVSSKDVVDLKAWTMDEVFANAQKACDEVWQIRDQLGNQSVSVLSEFINENTYPKEIRKTLRDAVSYLRVELLADTTGWRPDHSNEVYRLDLMGLLSSADKPDGAALRNVSLSDPAVHPLTRIAAALDDLEQWHVVAGRTEAALEARLTRLSHLWGSFTEAEDRIAIRKDLEGRLPAVKGKAWWAMGMATLAEFVRGEDTPDAQVRALALAEECAGAPSPGGLRCQRIAQEIRAPDFGLQAMSTDAPGKRSIGVEHRNLQALHFRAYAMDLLQLIASSDEYRFYPSGRALDALVASRKPTLVWKVDLPATPDYRMHRTFVTPPIQKSGFYVVVASARENFGERDNKVLATRIIVGDLVLLSRPAGDTLEVTVRSGSTGKAIPGATVDLYQFDWRSHHKKVASERTDAAGVVTFRQDRPRGSYFLVARHDSDIAVDDDSVYLSDRDQERDATSTLIFTDRSIYRPLQKVFFKAIVYTGRSATWKTLSNRTLKLSLMDPNHQVVDTLQLVTNDHGSAAGEFVVPAGRLLGSWRIVSSMTGDARLQVEEYKRPTFEAKIMDPPAPLRLNRPATLKGEVKYYFGLPVTTGTVKWKVTRVPVYPWYWAWWWGASAAPVRTQNVASGEASLQQDGTFSVTFTPQVDERLATREKDVTYRYHLSVDVTDEGGETRSAARAFRLGFVAVETAATFDGAFLRERQAASVTLMRMSLDGVPAPGTGTWRLMGLRGPATALLPADQPMPPLPDKNPVVMTEGDRLRPRWAPDYRPEAVMRAWEDSELFGNGTVTHDATGKATVALPALPAGAYRLRYTTTDAFGATFDLAREFVVAGTRTPVPLPALMMVEKGMVAVGDKARVLVLSGLSGQSMTLDRYRDGELVERRQIDAGRDATLIEFPIREQDRGGFGLTLSAVRDHQTMLFSIPVNVPWDDKELKVSFATFRDRLRPGTAETWRVTVTGPSDSDKAVAAAELLAYMYDRSLDAFVGHHPPNPSGLYPSFTEMPWLRTNLSMAPSEWVLGEFPDFVEVAALSGDALKFFDGYGIGGPGMRRYGGMRKSGRAMTGAVAMDADEGVAESAAMPMASRMAESPMPPPAPGQRAMKDGAPVAEAEANAGGGGAEAPVELRSNFSETAFWQPALLTGPDGSATIEFTVPDSVTSWNVWVHAITTDMKSGQLKKEAASVKELMVRPYLPRFLREGDAASLKVVINNASDHELKGTLDFDILDPDSGESLLSVFGLTREATSNRPFTVEATGGTPLTFPIRTPARVGPIAVKVTARSGDFSDGELRPLPVLPGRMHLAQSRFVTLKDPSSRTMTFADLAKNDDPSLVNERMVVTVDAQLFYSVLTALPYLVNYPYECVEQTLNRFLSTGIMASFYKDYPALARMAEQFSKRTTQFESWDQTDPNRKMALEETPWLQEAKGGSRAEEDLINVLDPRITRAQRDAALAKLAKAQTASGGFPWFPGGPPSPYMTLYLVEGFAKALEFGVDVPKPMVQRAWSYLHRHYLTELVDTAIAKGCCHEFVTYLNYVLSCFPDVSWSNDVFTAAERQAMLAFSFRHWKETGPYLKGYLALTLKRAGRDRDARLVWDSVMDSAKTVMDQGTFWAPEDRAWLWYNDTIQTHAFALRTLMEMDPQSTKLDGLVLWLFLNKKMNHWKSTRATAEVIYSLAHYLKKTGQLAIRETATVEVGGQTTRFVFEPDQYTGKKNQIVIPGEHVDPKTTSTITVSKDTKGHLFASATWHFSTERMPSEDRGDYLNVSRTYFKRSHDGREWVLSPLKEGTTIQVGDQLEVQISLRSKHPMEYVHLRDPRGAGFEPENAVSRHQWDMGIYWYEEIRDSGTNFFFERLPQGEYTFRYRVRAALPGTFKVAPATLQPMYAPEFAAYSSGAVIGIAEAP